jgi:uncharacterized membrane protein YdjX (TVP38/TMEM64 family)
VVILAGLVIAMTVVAASDTLHGAVDAAVGWAESVIRRHPVAGVLVFVVLGGLSAMLAFFSSALLVPVAVRTWGEVPTAALLWLSWFLGGLAAYSVARYLGRGVVHRLVPSRRLLFYERRIAAQARFPVVFLFQAALPSEVPGYVLGMVKCSLRVYLPALALAELPYAVAAVYLGQSFLAQRYALIVIVGLAAVGAAAWAFHRLHQHLGER